MNNGEPPSEEGDWMAQYLTQKNVSNKHQGVLVTPDSTEPRKKKISQDMLH